MLQRSPMHSRQDQKRRLARLPNIRIYRAEHTSRVAVMRVRVSSARRWLIIAIRRVDQFVQQHPIAPSF